MAKPIIEVENLSKLYRLGVIGSTTLRDSVERWWYRARGREEMCQKIGAKHLMIEPDDPQAGPEPNTLWALKDISFSVQRGEIIGIIRKNGAGKSTLLKILTRITEPTSGRAVIRGRTSSMLEVGTGFHPELTGRENIYLNGAILGMRKSEIDRKFDEIVDFSGVEKFIDTPAKRYSSGMYVRLAFAVAAHLEPEILLVDEVLAVGDFEFQKKCVGKMQNVSAEGRTILLVSHNMPTVTAMCPRAILLELGVRILDGQSEEVVGNYLRGGGQTTAEKTWPKLQEAPGNEVVRLRAARVCTQSGEVREFFDIRKPIAVEITFDVLQEGQVLTPNFHFTTGSGTTAFVASDQDPAWRRQPRPKGRFVSTAWVPGNFLAEGEMIVGVAVSTMRPKRVHFFEQNALSFEIVDSLDGKSARGDFAGRIPGVVRPLLRWTTEFKADVDPAMPLEILGE